MPQSLLLSFRGHQPTVAEDAWIAPGACLIGDVHIASGASVWFNAVLRADLARITLGRGSNLQDGTVVHVDPDGPCLIGDRVIVGHNTTLHACSIGDDCLIGMGAILLSGCTIGAGTVVAAGSLVKQNSRLEPNSLYAGAPARRLRTLPAGSRKKMEQGSRLYQELIGEYSQK